MIGDVLMLSGKTSEAKYDDPGRLADIAITTN